MATAKVRGITIELGADVAGVQSALKSVGSTLKSTQSELKDINKLLKLDPTNTELLAQKQSTLQRALEATKDKLKVLTDAEKSLSDQMTDGGTQEQQEQLAALRREIISCQTQCDKYEKELDEVASGEEDVGTSAESAESGTGTFNDTLKALLTSEVIKVGFTTIINGFKDIASSVTDFVGDVVSAYGNYEQLVGGVEKIFGESASIIEDYAAEAYKNAGMSANDYMETVTGFSASLINSLGGDTEKAAELANLAIEDMSDNANTFGTDMESVEAVYQSLAKGQYTTLDNLKLGYAGTKEGAQELIEAAEGLDSTFKAERDDAGNVTLAYSDMIQAIHIVQENMNITGTTQKEASKTIEGSLSTTKAAWQNLITGIGDANSDVKKLSKSVISSASNVVKNVTPIIENIADAVPEVLDDITDALEQSDILDAVLDTAESVVKGLSSSLPSMIGTINDTIGDLISDIARNLNDYIGPLLDAVPDLMGEVIDGVIDCLPDIMTGIGTLAGKIISELPAIVTEIVNSIPAMLQASVTGIGDAVLGVFKGLMGVTGEDLTDTISNSALELDDMKSAFQQASDEISGEYSTWYNQWGLLEDMVEPSGKVKDGYEDMAQVLINQLNDALGLNIEYLDGQIKDYDTLKQSIQDVMDQKRAELYLEAEEEEYSAALEAREGLINNVTTAQNYLTIAEQELAQAHKDNDEILKTATEGSMEYVAAQTAIETAEQGVTSATSDLTNAQNVLNDNTAICAQYMGDYTSAIEGDYAAIGNASSTYTGSTIEDLKAYASELQATAKSDKANYDTWYQSYEKFGDDYSKQQMDYYQNRYDTDQTQLDKVNQLISEGGKDYTAEYINGLLSGETDVTEATTEITDASTDTIDDTKDDFKESGEEIVDSVAEGMESESDVVSDQMSELEDTILSDIDVINETLESHPIHVPISADGLSYETSGSGADTTLTPKSTGTYKFARGYDQAMLLNNATIFGMANGKSLVGGDRSGSEVVVGEQHLLDMIAKVSGNEINVIINGAEGQSTEELAEEVVDRISSLINSQRGAYV